MTRLSWCGVVECVTIPVMNKRHVINLLRAHEKELRSAGIVHLRVFGSVARGEASPSSDVDLMVELSRIFMSWSGLEGFLQNG